MVIFRYLCKEFYANILAITLVLLVIFITNQFVHYLKDAASGQLTMTSVLEIMSLQVPILLGYLLPLALYLSILLAFGRMYMDHEMTVLAACGLSRAKILRITFIFAICIAVVVAWLMLWAEPRVQQFRTKIVKQAVTEASLQKVVPGRFQSLGNGGVFYTDVVHRSDHTLGNVFLAMPLKVKKAGEPQKWDVTVAKHAKDYTDPRYGHFIAFYDGYRYQGAPGLHQFKAAQYQRYGMHLAPANVRVNDWPLNALSSDLWKEHKTNLRAAAALQWRIAMPISALILTLLAVPLSRVNPRKGKFAQLIPAILIYVAYADLIFLGRAWIKKGVISPLLGLWWVHALALTLAIILIIQHAGFKRVARWCMYPHKIRVQG